MITSRPGKAALESKQWDTFSGHIASLGDNTEEVDIKQSQRCVNIVGVCWEPYKKINLGGGAGVLAQQKIVTRPGTMGRKETNWGSHENHGTSGENYLYRQKSNSSGGCFGGGS